jgi:ketosteroid isomerase-like protein
MPACPVLRTPGFAQRERDEFDVLPGVGRGPVERLVAGQQAGEFGEGGLSPAGGDWNHTGRHGQVRDGRRGKPMAGTIGQVTDRATVSRWLAGYEAAWRAPGTDGLAGLFANDATYLQSPYEQPVTGLAAIRRMWEEEREGPGEIFTLATEILAVDGPTAVIRAEVRYGDPPRQEYRDLWVIRLGEDGRCSWFEEWPYWPQRPYSARDDTL